MSAAQDAAALVVGDMHIPGAETEAPDEGSSTEAAVAPEDQAQETAPFDLSPELPDELAELLDEPDFEEEAAAEIAAAPPEDGEEYAEYEDEAVGVERRKRIAAEKRAAWFEGQRVKEHRERWVTEADKFFPLADTESIKATSRRGFLKEARRQHEVLKPKFEKLANLARAQNDTDAAEARQEARETAKQAWGTPSAGPGGPPAEAAEKTRQMEKIQMGTGGVSGLIARKFMEGGYGQI